MTKNNLNLSQTFGDMFMGLYEEWKVWLFLYIAPGLISAIGAMTTAYGISLEPPVVVAGVQTAAQFNAYMIAGLIISWVGGLMYLIRVLRLKLAKEPVNSLLSVEWTKRHWMLAGLTLVVSFLCVLAALIPALATVLIMMFVAQGAPDAAIVVLPLLYLIVLMTILFVYGRLILFNAFVALDKPKALVESWKWTEGGLTWLKAGFLTLIVPGLLGWILRVVMELIGLLEVPYVGAGLSAFIGGFVTSTLVGLALVSSYKQLSAMGTKS